MKMGQRVIYTNSYGLPTYAYNIILISQYYQIVFDQKLKSEQMN